MNLEVLILDGYGQFVWPAFVFTIVSSVLLYIKTKKELKKQEKLFSSEFKYLPGAKIELGKQKKLLNEVISSNTTY